MVDFFGREITFLIFFIGSAGLAYFITRLIRNLATKLGIYDIPDGQRKLHAEPKPKLGGLALYFSLVFGLLVAAALGLTDEISGHRVAGVILGGGILLIGGVLDDKYNLSPKIQFLFPLFAALVVVVSGNHISYITNPLGGDIVLDQFKFFGLPVLGSILVLSWILGMTYTTKFLDGMDGLVAGIAAIAGLVIFALSLRPEVNQTSTAFLALIFAAVCIGFLPFNWNPAKIFLGEGGSTFTGFMIGVLAVISGGKIATALLVLGIPVLDAAWVILRRLWFRTSPFVGDRKHLHFRLLDIGFSQRQAVVFLYALSLIFGSVAVFLQSIGKLVALGILFMVMILVAVIVVAAYRRKQISGHTLPSREEEVK